MLTEHPKPYYEDFFGLGPVNTVRISFLLCGLVATWLFPSIVSVWWIPAFVANLYVMSPRLRSLLDRKFFDKFEPPR